MTVGLRPYDGGSRSDNVWKLGGPKNNPFELISFITEASGQLVGPSSLGTMSFTLVTHLSLELEERTAARPEAFALDQNYPNPFNGGTTIGYSIMRGGPVELILFDLAGHSVATDSPEAWNGIEDLSGWVRFGHNTPDRHY